MHVVKAGWCIFEVARLYHLLEDFGCVHCIASAPELGTAESSEHDMLLWIHEGRRVSACCDKDVGGSCPASKAAGVTGLSMM